MQKSMIFCHGHKVTILVNFHEFLLKNGLTVLSAIDQRYRTPFMYYGTGTPFEYDLVRLLYTEKRRFLIEE